MIGKRLVKLRNDVGLTQEEISSLLNISRGTYAHYEIDKRNPDYETLQRIADFYSVTTDYLLGRTNNKNAYYHSPNHPHYLSVSDNSVKYDSSTEQIKSAITSDPELAEFWDEISQREDLQLMFKQARDLSPQSIKKVIRIIKAIEDEEAEE